MSASGQNQIADGLAADIRVVANGTRSLEIEKWGPAKRRGFESGLCRDRLFRCFNSIYQDFAEVAVNFDYVWAWRLLSGLVLAPALSGNLLKCYREVDRFVGKFVGRPLRVKG
jgi:hypothetical protein